MYGANWPLQNGVLNEKLARIIIGLSPILILFAKGKVVVVESLVGRNSRLVSNTQQKHQLTKKIGTSFKFSSQKIQRTNVMIVKIKNVK